MKDCLLKFYYFAVACVWLLGTIGGTAYLFYDKRTLFGVVSILVAAMAFPYVYHCVKRLLSV